jgi:tight adherence protein B
MNTELLSTLLLAAVFFLVFVGVYKLRLEKKIKTAETLQHLFKGEGDAGLTTAASAQQLAAAQAKMQASSVLKRVKPLKKQAQQRANDLEKANWLLRPEELVLLQVVAAAGVGVLMFLGKVAIPLVIVGAIVGFVLPLLCLKVKIWLRMGKANAQFADVLDALVNCFKTGYGFNRALQVIADNFEDPWGTEFGKMCTEITLGAQPDEVLQRLTERVPSPDVDLFVTGMLIQRETGGNLAELLGNLARICRERQKLLRKVGAISAQGKLSALIVICVPFLLFAMMYGFQQAAVTQFVTSLIGIILLSVAGIWMACGVFVLWKIVSIEV